MLRGPERLLRNAAWRDAGARRVSRFDLVLALGLAVVIQVEYHVDYAGLPGISLAATVSGLALSVPLIWRRVAPVPVGLGVIAVFSLQPELVKPTPNTFGAAICIAVASAALALYPRRWATAVLCCAAAGALGLLGGYLDPNPDGIEGISTMLYLVGVWVGAAFLRAQVQRTRRSDEALLRERVAADERARELVTSERARIARELHDVVAHGMGVLVLQARGGRRVIDSDPARARQAFDEIERLSTESLREMRLMLDVLRIDDYEVLDPPQPSLSRLDDLLHHVRTAGLRVDAEAVGAPVALPTGLDLSAYRIVQEALTNVMRHGDGAAATLRIGYGESALRIDVVDDGADRPPALAGHGLVGMAERVRMFDGSLRYGREPDGGFGVHAVLPYPSAATT